MALSSQMKRAKNERIAVYLDILLGTISSVFALTGIIYVGILGDIEDWGMYIFGLIFWICWLILSLFLICLGIFLWYQEKHFDERGPRKDIKAQIV